MKNRCRGKLYLLGDSGKRVPQEFLETPKQKHLKEWTRKIDQRVVQIEVSFDPASRLYLAHTYHNGKLLSRRSRKRFDRGGLIPLASSLEMRPLRVPWQKVDLGDIWRVDALLDKCIWSRFEASYFRPPVQMSVTYDKINQIYTAEISKDGIHLATWKEGRFTRHKIKEKLSYSGVADLRSNWHTIVAGYPWREDVVLEEDIWLELMGIKKVVSFDEYRQRRSAAQEAM